MENKERWYKTPAMKDALSLIGHAVSNIALIAAKGSFGWPAFLASTAIVTGGQVIHARRQVTKAEKDLLDFYGDKLGTLLHKDPKSLTLADLHKAAASKEHGGLGITTLTRQVEKFEQFRKIKTIGRVVGMAIVAASIVGAGALGLSGGLAAIGFMTGVATVISKTVEGVTDAILRKKDEGRVTQQVFALSQQVKNTDINPIQVLDVFVKARPEMEKAVSTRYGKYSELTAQQKSQIVRDSEPALHLAALTGEINKGTIKPNLIGFLAYNDNFEELPDYQRYKALASAPLPEQAAPEPQQSQHVEKVLAEKREMAPRTVH